MTLVDSNVLLDVFGGDPTWTTWSRQQLDQRILRGPLVINDIVYAEISVRFSEIDLLDSTLSDIPITVVPMSKAVLFVAGKAFLKYRRAGGARTSILPDFFIGAHAAVEGIPLLTRDSKRYRAYFPTVSLIEPNDLNR